MADDLDEKELGNLYDRVQFEAAGYPKWRTEQLLRHKQCELLLRIAVALEKMAEGGQ